ncbi:hypothetical protein [Planctomicrobium piriforme]|uniref:Secreted protein n=1 Tax=Planctomicrobium piriforme TaxID=1576369 RepID=A0A1I3EL25_9PLAN|nr:hypothetical protein [Planctomicrobium piriforme]SFH99578.1 hypothetical protein SAMN05421753_104268 [Planctomicrobium piriforme]
MKLTMPTVVCASLAFLCFFCSGTTAEAGGHGRYCPTDYVSYGMNPPTERDDCDYKCAGYGHKGWYQRNFGSNYSYACFPANDHAVCSPLGHCYTRHYGRWVR